jgi:hypothetical protein
MKYRLLVIISLLTCIMALSATVVSAQEAETYGISAEAIEEYPIPNVQQIYVNKEIISPFMYRRLAGASDLYDAPNGNVVGNIGEGFTFVTVIQMDESWAKISPDRWVRSEMLTEDVAMSIFAGVMLPEEPLPYPMAWLLVHARGSKTPGGEEAQDNPFLYRYTKVSIYSVVEVDGWDWYQIGVDQWVHQTKVAKYLSVERPEDVDTDRWISIDLYEQVAVAYEGETPVFTTLVSSGMRDWTTNEGLFHIYLRYISTPMSGADGEEDFYYLEGVPWTMYFDDEIALHGAYWHDGFGYRRSHGCVNLSMGDAHWLYDWAESELDFTVDNDLGATVYVYSSGDYVGG